MTTPPGANITALLGQMCAGDQPARDLLIEVVYTELHRIARGYLRKERPDHTLQPTALVHEAYLKLFHGAEIGFENRAHFFAVVSQAVRRILVDHARARVTARRDAGIQADWDTSIDVGTDQRYDLLDLDLALDALARDKPPLARLIEMRYFGGMTAEQSAEVLGRSVHMVRHDLRLALAWLRRELAQQET